MYREIELQEIRIRLGQAFSEHVLLRGADVDVTYEAMAGMFNAQMEKRILVNHDGRSRTVRARAEATAVANVEYENKLKPRWVPTFLWNRIKTETLTASKTQTEVAHDTKTYQPAWVFPYAPQLESKLGAPVRILIGDNF